MRFNRKIANNQFCSFLFKFHYLPLFFFHFFTFLLIFFYTYFHCTLVKSKDFNTYKIGLVKNRDVVCDLHGQASIWMFIEAW